MSAEKLQPLAFGLSDIGKKRLHNEDNYALIGDLNLFLLADGMGGHAAGETASKLAIKTVENVVRQHQARLTHPQTAKEAIGAILIESLRKACHHVHQAGLSDIRLHGMGTTLTALLLHNSYAHMAHVGDSRLYRFRAGQLEQVSEDHSLVHEQVKLGIMTKEQACYSRLKNVITRSIGYLDDVDVDYERFSISPKDTFLLCSDGLTNMVSDHVIADYLSTYAPAELPGRLIQLANDQGGEDNITLLVIALE